jgi:hypothetical protein
MKIKHLPAVISLLSTLSSATWSTIAAAENTLRLEGAIVERVCHSSVKTQGMFELNTCPALARATVFGVNSLDWSRRGIRVKLLADSGQDRYFDQRYALVDGKGAAAGSGNYVVTMTLP